MSEPQQGWSAVGVARIVLPLVGGSGIGSVFALALPPVLVAVIAVVGAGVLARPARLLYQRTNAAAETALADQKKLLAVATLRQLEAEHLLRCARLQLARSAEDVPASLTRPPCQRRM